MCQLKPTGSMYYVIPVLPYVTRTSLSIHFLVLVCVSVHGNYKLLRNRLLRQGATYETKYQIIQQPTHYTSRKAWTVFG